MPVTAVQKQTPPEVDLLLCCARTGMDPESASRILLSEQIDWPHLIRQATRHRIISLLYWNLNVTGIETVPKNVLSELQGCFQAIAVGNLHQTSEMLKLLELFKGHGIAACPIKGPVIAAEVYGNLALRQFSDLDILVHKRDLKRGKELLLSQGYRLWLEMTDEQETAYQRSEHAYRFVRDNKPTIVELHWEIIPRYLAFPLDIERLWERLEPVSLGETVKSLAPEDLLLYLCVHGAKHSWERLSWICDVAELLRKHQRMNWEQVMAQAKTLNSERRLFLGLFLARDILDVILPEPVLQRLEKNPAIKSLAVTVHQRLFREEDHRSRIFQRHLFQLRVMERFQDRVRYAWYCLWIPNNMDWAVLRLPTFLSFLYSPLRLIRLIRKHGTRLFKRLPDD